MTFDVRRDTQDIYVGTYRKQEKAEKEHKRKENAKYKGDYRNVLSDNVDKSDKPLLNHNVKKTDSDYIKRRRNELKLTQKELAVKCNLNVKIIQDYENGTAILNNKTLSCIKKHLQ